MNKESFLHSFRL